MDFKAEDFPLYQHLLALNAPGVETAKADFEAAVRGGEVEKVDFAFGLQTVAANVPASAIPGCTEEIMTQTLRSCLRVFNEAAAHGNATAVAMVKDFKARGLGL